MGGKGFCFKHSKVVKDPSIGCSDFRLRIDNDEKKRWIIEETQNRPSGADTSTAEKIDVIAKPVGHPDFKLEKKSTIKTHPFIETPVKDEELLHPRSKIDVEGQTILLAIIIGGILLLIIILFLTGTI